MTAQKKDIIARLRREILPLEGLRSVVPGTALDLGLGPLNKAFPHFTFPVGAVHEFIAEKQESAAASAGFIAGILSGLMKNNGVAFWISTCRTLFPPALKGFGIEPDRIVFVDLKKEKDVLWAMEEALKCDRLAAVVGELPDLSFTTSRRFQLAVEQSQVTGFVLRHPIRNLIPNACVSRWKIEPMPTLAPDELPGLGFPRWDVELLKIRNGRPGQWQMEWGDGRFRNVDEIIPSIFLEPKQKTG